jgi:prepilin-type N-terminal cleavage/methylation domain-containing protein
VKRQAFTVIELLVVIGVIAIILSLMYPALRAQREFARIEEMRSQLGILEAAIQMYHGRFGDYPPSAGSGANAGNEMLIAHLLTRQGGGPFLPEHKTRNWLGDTDGDGQTEFLDPWGNPWIYFHHLDYSGPEATYRIQKHTVQFQPVKPNDGFANRSTYQLWSLGPNQINEDGSGDDVANF